MRLIDYYWGANLYRETMRNYHRFSMSSPFLVDKVAVLKSRVKHLSNIVCWMGPGPWVPRRSLESPRCRGETVSPLSSDRESLRDKTAADGSKDRCAKPWVFWVFYRAKVSPKSLSRSHMMPQIYDFLSLIFLLGF